MKTKVAALQFASGVNLDENLATCLRLIDRASQEAADVMVLPEFSNHISWYNDADHAWRVSLDRDGEFLQTIATRAAQYQSYIVINVSLRQRDKTLTVTSLCYDPHGQLVGTADKQTLMGHENTWFARAQMDGDIIDAPFGRLAMFPCRDGVTCETPRALALRGAQLFCDSLNSFALDEASLHVPARAPENKVFLVAANKIGPLIPEHLLEAVSEQTHIPQRFLNGAGESQIVSTSGEILARGPRSEEAVVSAEIDLAQADNKARPDGTDLFTARRPRLYLPVTVAPVAPVCQQVADTSVRVALLLTETTGETALDELPGLVDQLPMDTALAVLPELFCYGSPECLRESPDTELASRAVAAMVGACADRQLMLCASLIMPVGAGHGVVSILVNSGGELARQPQLHRSARFPWMELGGELSLVDLPWGRLAMITGDDMVFPELVKVAAIRGAHVVASSLQLQEPWEEAFGLRSRAAENRVCLIASSRPLGGRAGLIADLDSDFTLMTEWQQRSFDGFINAPLVTEQGRATGSVSAVINPSAAVNKLMSEQTDLLLDRPWQRNGVLVESHEGDNHV